MFKNCVRLFEKCTFEYKVGEPRYDYVFMFVYLRSSPLSESDESEPSGGAQSHPTRHCTWLQPEAHHAHKHLGGYIFHKHLDTYVYVQRSSFKHLDSSSDISSHWMVY